MRWQHDTLQPSHGVAEVIDTPECWFLLIIVLNSHLRSCTPSDTNLANSAPLWCLPHHHTHLYLQCIQVTGPHSNWNTACKDFHSWPGRLLCQLVNSTSNCIGPRVRSHLWLLLVGARQIPNTNLPIGRAFVRENSDLEGVNAQALRKQKLTFFSGWKTHNSKCIMDITGVSLFRTIHGRASVPRIGRSGRVCLETVLGGCHPAHPWLNLICRGWQWRADCMQYGSTRGRSGQGRERGASISNTQWPAAAYETARPHSVTRSVERASTHSK